MKIYITAEFDITTLSFRVRPVKWNVSISGDSDPDMRQYLPGYSHSEDGSEYWTVEISVDNGRIRNWPHGIDAEVSLFDPDGVYLIEDEDSNSVTYSGPPPECLRIDDDRDISFYIDEEGFIRDWEFSIDLLKEWGSSSFISDAPVK